MDRYSIRWRMYATSNLDGAADAYERAIGHRPTLCLSRPEHYVHGGAGILVLSDSAAADALLLTHEATPTDWEKSTGDKPVERKIEQKHARHMRPVDIVPKKPAHRPTRGGGVCPHCKQRIADFNDLGFWYGWAEGITPPYWEDLCHFVFQRDNFRCQKCSSQLPTSKLTAHHIVAKEEGGTDSARNLMTLCKDCHLDTKPIFDDNDH